ncbi:type IV secretion system protein [Cellulomonas sp. RIT-PI-Y]|uniref:type IV secretion system protein n=1 Tax=Cellulomonas sp. RIT-PI-Y TaxID=3035297 RepID=UPI0021D9C54E|nr:type IV secretion system protein [Cellulomonas sp. RIT-PI-Y]
MSTATTPVPTDVFPQAGVRRSAAELAAAPALVRTWWASQREPGHRRRRVLGAGVVAVGVVALCSAAWWDPAVEAVFNKIGEWIVKAAIDAISTACEQFMSLAFNNPLTEISDVEWQIATRQAARWGAVFAVVAVAMCAVEVVAALIVRDATRVLRAGMIAVLSWPMTVAAILLLAQLVSITDGLSGQMFDNVAGSGATGSAAAATAMGAAAGGLTALTVGGGWIVIVIGALVCIVGLVLIAMVMAARAFGLLVATGFAPTALMMVGFKGTRGMASKWVEVVVGLLLTKPLGAGIIVLCLEMAGEGNLDSFIMGTVGIWVAVFSPALALSLVSFAGGQLSAALTAHSDAVKSAGSQATQAGMTRMALGGPDKEALSTLGNQAAGLAKAMGMSGLASKLSDLGSKDKDKSEDAESGGAGAAPAPDDDGASRPGQPPAGAAVPEGPDGDVQGAGEDSVRTAGQDGLGVAGDSGESVDGDFDTGGGLGASSGPEGVGAAAADQVRERGDSSGAVTGGESGAGSARSSGGGGVQAGPVHESGEVPAGSSEAAAGGRSTGSGECEPPAPASSGDGGTGGPGSGGSGGGGVQPGPSAPSSPAATPAPSPPSSGGEGGRGPNPFGGR